MSYLGSWKIDDVVTFCANTHDPSDGSSADATGSPAYRVYEDETGTPILTGSMAKLDDAGTLGFYSGQITCSAANGFEKGKSYSIFISATVAAVAVTTHHTMQIEAEVDANTVSPTVSADVVQVSGDSTAADNLELQYDTTGLTGDTFPATQTQLGNIALTGAAVATPAKDEPNGFVIAFGENEANDEDSTHALDGTTHDIEAQDDTGTEKIDVYYEFNIGGDGVPTGVSAVCQFDKGGGATKNLTIQALNWPSTWETIGTLQSGTSLGASSLQLFTSHVGTGANLGLVRIRYLTGSVALTATSKLLVDQIFVEYAIVRRSVGYADGAIWVNTSASPPNTNTENYVDGTADNPVSTWAAALALSSQLGIIRFRIVNGSSITLSGASDNYTLIGSGWTLALGSVSIDGIYIEGADLSGIGTNGGTGPNLVNCHIGNVTMPPCHVTGCGLMGTFTAGSAGDFFFDNCHSQIAGTSTPIFDFGTGLDASDANFRSYSGGIDIRFMGAGSGSYNLSIEGFGHVILNANCTPTSTVAIRGNFTLADSSTVTVSDDARIDVGQINAQALDVLFTDAQAELSSLPAANAPIAAKINLIFEILRNKLTNDGSTQELFKDNGSSSLGTQSLSVAAGKVTRAKYS